MRTAYFDCYSGISGNMILGALLDLGVDIEILNEGLRSLGLDSFEIAVTRQQKNDISAVYADVMTSENGDSRTISDIVSIVDRGALDEDIKIGAKRIFYRLAEAEAKVHGRHEDQVRLHEVGATDTIIDVVGSLVGLKALGVGEIGCSPLNLGSGTVLCGHGSLPVPAPITAELVKGVQVYSSGLVGELTTPTGAAIVTTLAGWFGAMPLLRVSGVGYGAGRMDLDVPNALRIFLGERVDTFGQYRAEPLVLLETNIDDMNPQFYEHILESLLENGALDVFLTPVHMKKSRPGILLSALARRETVETLAGLIFREGTTLGVRMSEVDRLYLPRSTRFVQTRFGAIRVKLSKRGDRMVTVSPEYDDCRKAAKEHGVPLALVYEEVQQAWRDSGTPSEILDD
jgi:uncharacterized protein (TIGR00299 family) protein